MNLFLPMRRPWTFVKGAKSFTLLSSSGFEKLTIFPRTVNPEVDIKLIIKAVNVHEELLAMAINLLGRTEVFYQINKHETGNESDPFSNYRDILRRAIGDQ